jgi:hypothetical protein
MVVVLLPVAITTELNFSLSQTEFTRDALKSQDRNYQQCGMNEHIRNNQQSVGEPSLLLTVVDSI